MKLAETYAALRALQTVLFYPLPFKISLNQKEPTYRSIKKKARKLSLQDGFITVKLLAPDETIEERQLARFLCEQENCGDLLDSDMVLRHAKYFHSCVRADIDFGAYEETSMRLYAPAVYMPTIIIMENGEEGVYFDADAVSQEKMWWVPVEQ